MNLILRIFALILILGFLACSSVPFNNSSKMNNEGMHLPPMIEKDVSNGSKIIFIKDNNLPKITIVGMIKTGAVQDPSSQRGLNYLTASLMDEGTLKHNSSEIAERMEFLGGELNISPGSDFTTLTVKGLSYTKADLMDSFFEVLMTPQFPEKEILRIQKQVRDEIQRAEDEPDHYASTMFTKLLFGQQPYGYPIYGSYESLSRIKRKDIIKHYLKYYNPANSVIAVAGDFDDDFIKSFEAKLQTWLVDKEVNTTSNEKSLKISRDSNSNSNSTSNNELNNVNLVQTDNLKPTIYFQNKKGLVQSQIRMGQIFIDRNDPDFLKLRLANMAFGGAFASRLNQKVRDDLALTYGISSYLDAKKQSGSFVMNTFTRNEKVGEAIQVSLNEFKNFQEKGITEAELQASKSVLIGQFPRSIETLDMLTYNLLVLRFYGISDSYLTQFNQNIQSFKLEDINDAIHKKFQPQKIQILVFGEDKVSDQLKKFANVKLVPKNWKD